MLVLWLLNFFIFHFHTPLYAQAIVLVLLFISVKIAPVRKNQDGLTVIEYKALKALENLTFLRSEGLKMYQQY